ncbi:MAG: hypothetical protein MRZ79_03385 [Bacteroidia bacterium]|nr:hypothetical protein [Bacteroidia bacterium]
MDGRISEEDKSLIIKYFGKALKELDSESFQEALKEAKKTYHPDKFSKYDDELILEMAKERFQQIQQLEVKVSNYLKVKENMGEDTLVAEDDSPEKGYYTDGIMIDIMTTDKHLKYRLFNSPIIDRGDKAIIKGTNARLVALEDYSPRVSAGFRDNIKIKLIFGLEDSVYEIANWIFKHISGKTSSFVIENKLVKITPGEILNAIRGEARLELGS